MEAGHLIDALVARYVFGKEVSWYSLQYVEGPEDPRLKSEVWKHGLFSSQRLNKGEGAEVYVANKDGDMPLRSVVSGEYVSIVYAYSNEIEYMWRVVEHFTDKEYEISVGHSPGVIGYWCNIHDRTRRPAVTAASAKAPLAVCRAALMMKESEGVIDDWSDLE
jgi:hypothetical protein